MKHIFKFFLLILRKYRTSSILNIVGLSVAYAVFFVIMVQAWYDFGFDRNFKKANNIYLYSRTIPDKSESFHVVTNAIEPRICAERHPEIKNFCYLQTKNVQFGFDSQNDVNIDLDHLRMLNVQATYASIGFQDMFSPKVISGDIRQAFTHGKAMITKELATLIFGEDNPVGKVFYYHNSTDPIIIAALCEDFPQNCSLKNGLYFFQPETPLKEWNYSTYMEVNPKDKEKLITSLNDDKEISGSDNNWQFRLTALPDIHFRFSANKSNFTTILTLLATGILLLVIAYINFLNFYVSMAPVRLKSFNIRKILGESAFALKLTIVLEAVFFSLIAFLLSLSFVYLLNTSVIQDFFIADLSLAKNHGLIWKVAGISLVTGFLAGIYPANYSTSFHPAMVLSGSFSISSKSRWLKYILSVVQFTTTLFLVIVTLFLEIQHAYMRNKDWGINTENVLYIDTKSMDVVSLENELKKNSSIVNICFSQYCPENDFMQHWEEDIEDSQMELYIWAVSPGERALPFFEVQIVEGRGFDEKDQGQNKLIVNQSFVRKYGKLLNKTSDKDFIGTTLNMFYNHEIIGIVEDFNFMSVREPIKPMAFKSDPPMWYIVGWTYIKIRADNIPQTIEYIRNTIKKFSNDPVEIKFLDETLQKLYKKENDQAKLASIAGGIAIVVIVIGLYSSILFNVKSKRKNIAIRKVNGASTNEIIWMLNRDLLIQFIVSCGIAIPLAYFLVRRWLDTFASKIPIYWWIFALGGIVVLTISLLTVSWQSYKAATANPVEALKTD